MIVVGTIRKQSVIDLLLETGADVNTDCRMLGSIDASEKLECIPKSGWEGPDSTHNSFSKKSASLSAGPSN